MQIPAGIVPKVIPALAGLLSFIAFGQALAQGGPPTTVLFEDVRIFDGTGAALSGLTNVLVRGNTIERFSSTPIPVDRRADARIVQGGGRTLMPGLIDVHFHMMLASVPLNVALGGPEGYLNLIAAREANDTLMRGFTSVRDLAGPVFSSKRAIDEGLIPGP